MDIKAMLSAGIDSSELVEVDFSGSKSEIIIHNGYIAYCAMYRCLAGIFNRDNNNEYQFGKSLCDNVKKEMVNGGFFTTDELPAYGLTIFEKNKLLTQIFEFPDDSFVLPSRRDLVVCFAYGRDEAERTKNYLDHILLKAARELP